MFILGLLLIPLGFVFYRIFERDGGVHPCVYSGRTADTKVNNALEILNERYARGDISQEEYRTKKQDLMR